MLLLGRNSDCYGGNLSYQAPPPPTRDQGPTYQGKTLAAWIENLKSSSAKARGEAAEALGHFGARGKDAIDPLISTLNDRDPFVRLEASLSLAKLGTMSIPALREAVKTGTRLQKMGACLSLGHLGAAAAKAVPDLEGLLAGKDSAVRGHAAQAIWRISRKANLVLPALHDGLQAADKAVRMGDLSVLSQMGTAAGPAIPDIKKLLDDTDPQIRLAAALTLWHINPREEGIVPALAASLKDADVSIRIAAIRALGQVGPDAPGTVKALGTGMADANPAVGYESAIALSDMGAAGARALAVALKADKVAMRKNAAIALGHMGSDAKDAVPALIEATRDSNEYVRILARSALKEIDPKAAAKAGIE
jgi:HEAT repeat protein